MDAPDPAVGCHLYGQDPCSYDAGRPDYPERVYDVLVERCGLAVGSRVIELGPGTGLATARMLALGAHVTGVEVDPSMAAYLQESLGGKNLEVVVGPFEEAELTERAFDLAVAANAFHWIRPGVGGPKLRRLLVPGGWVAVWAMLFDDPTRPDALAPFMERLLGVSSTFASSAGDLPFRLDEAERLPELHQAGFLNVESEIIRSEVTMDAAQVRGLYASMTLILGRPPGEQAQLLDAIEATVRDEFGGHVERHFVTGLFTGRNP
ncbi:MAG TPA: class I SAM-dependent methyltransferase [Acidimicrobiales bacterium]|nr:class I SAM-dependent methyltransferase [Acidimicrobiales bacterium]